MRIINQLVVEHGEDYRLSELFLPTSSDRHCWVLEDTARAYGVKIPGKTALPAGMYRVAYTYSPKFKRNMLHLHTDTTKYNCQRGGVTFTGIRVHGGNTVADTEGCPIVGKCRQSTDTIYESAEVLADLETKVVEWLATGEQVYWIITDVSYEY